MEFGNPTPKIEFAKRLIGTLSYAYLQQGDAVGLSLLRANKTDEIPAKRNPAQLQDILYTLGRAQASGKNSVIPQLHDLAEATKAEHRL